MKRLLKGILVGIVVLIGVILAAFAAGYVAVGYFADPSDFDVAATTADDPALPQITVNGLRLHAEAFGDPASHTVIVLHGGPGNSYKALLPLKALADRYHVVFYDQRGSGLSERVEEDQLTLDAMIEELHGLVAHYSPGRPVSLIGHSWGAMLATAYMGRYPEIVSRAVLAEPGFLTPETAQIFVERTNGMMPAMTWRNLTIVVRGLLESLHVDGPDSHAAGDYLFRRIAGSPDVDGHPLAGYFCGGDPSRGALEDFRFGFRIGGALMQSAMDEQGNFTVDFTTGIDRFRGDVLFVASECNTIIGVDQQEKHMKFFKEPRLAVIPGAGHTMFGEKPEATLPILREFLAGGG